MLSSIDIEVVIEMRTVTLLQGRPWLRKRFIFGPLSRLFANFSLSRQAISRLHPLELELVPFAVLYMVLKL